MASLHSSKMDQDTVVDNQFLMHRLAQGEQTFDDSLAREINNLVSHTANAWKSFDEKESENLARLISDMDETEKDVQTQSSDLESLTNYIKGMETNLEIRNEQLPAKGKTPH